MLRQLGLCDEADVILNRLLGSVLGRGERNDGLPFLVGKCVLVELAIEEYPHGAVFPIVCRGVTTGLPTSDIRNVFAQEIRHVSDFFDESPSQRLPSEPLLGLENINVSYAGWNDAD